MSSVTSKFSTAETCVLWDLDYCPIPVGHSPASICANIKSALKNIGYSGTMSISAYSLEKLNEEDFESAATIKLFQPGSPSAKREMMFVDLYRWGLQHRSEPTNLMLISRNISEDLNYVRTLLDLKDHENNILLAQPENAVGILRGIPSFFWLWTSLSSGGCPLDGLSGSSQVIAPSPTSSSQVVTPSSSSQVVAPSPTSSSSQVVAPSPTSPPRSGNSLHVAKKKKKKRTLLPYKKPKSTNSED